MTLITDITKLESDWLTVTIAQAVNDAILSGAGEPGIVANIAQNIPNYLKRIAKVGKYELASGSVANVPGTVFVHQTPKVTFEGMPKTSGGRPGSIEIGDLLLLSTIKPLKGDTQRRAMLLQAKMFDKLPVRQTGNDAQHKLYKDWPIFKYHRSGTELNDKYRFIYGPDLYGATKYLLLSKTVDPLMSWHHWFQNGINFLGALTAEPTKQLSKYLCFVHEMHDFILGNRGKIYNLLEPTEYERNSKDHSLIASICVEHCRPCWMVEVAEEGWELVINDLLTVTASKTTRLMKTAPGSDRSGERGVNISMLLNEPTSSLMKVSKRLGGGRNEPPPEERIDDGEPGNGLNVVEIVLTETEDQSNRE